ncbi:MAG: hypothetical protein PVF65_12410 [Sphingomonadales bacterium]|jgi:hypothetical protein
MSNQRTHIRFPADTNIPGRIDFVGLYYDPNGYRVHVVEFAKANADILEIDFGMAVLAQRSFDEGDCLTMTASADTSAGVLGPIVLVKNSKFLRWFHEQSLNIHSNEDLFHVAILTQNEWVEVISNKLPKLKWLP